MAVENTTTTTSPDEQTQTVSPIDEQTQTVSPDEQTTTTSSDDQNTTVSPLDEQAPTVSPAEQTTTSLDEELSQKRGQLTEIQITQTQAYSDYMKVMKAKSSLDESDTDKIAKLDKLMYQYFTTYQNALEDSQKLQFEISELESQKYLEEILP